MSDPKFGDIYEWTARAGMDSRVMYICPNDKTTSIGIPLIATISSKVFKVGTVCEIYRIPDKKWKKING